MSSPRFELYLKGGSEPGKLGDCPFSHRANMYSRIKMPDFNTNVHITYVDIANRTPEFYALSPDGKVPVLVDNEKKKTVVDSGLITEYVDSQFPSPDMQQHYKGPALDAVSGIFPTLGNLIMATDPKSPELRKALDDEFQKLENYLQSRDKKTKFLLSDDVCEIDCMILPRIHHVLVAGKHYSDYDIPGRLAATHEYIKCGEALPVFKITTGPDKEYIHGWSRHL